MAEAVAIHSNSMCKKLSAANAVLLQNSNCRLQHCDLEERKRKILSLHAIGCLPRTKHFTRQLHFPTIPIGWQRNSNLMIERAH